MRAHTLKQQKPKKATANKKTAKKPATTAENMFELKNKNSGM